MKPLKDKQMINMKSNLSFFLFIITIIILSAVLQCLTRTFHTELKWGYNSLREKPWNNALKSWNVAFIFPFSLQQRCLQAVRRTRA